MAKYVSFMKIFITITQIRNKHLDKFFNKKFIINKKQKNIQDKGKDCTNKRQGR